MKRNKQPCHIALSGILVYDLDKDSADDILVECWRVLTAVAKNHTARAQSVSR